MKSEYKKSFKGDFELIINNGKINFTEFEYCLVNQSEYLTIKGDNIYKMIIDILKLTPSDYYRRSDILIKDNSECIIRANDALLSRVSNSPGDPDEVEFILNYSEIINITPITEEILKMQVEYKEYTMPQPQELASCQDDPCSNCPFIFPVDLIIDLFK